MTASKFWLPGEPGYEHGHQVRRAALVCTRGHPVRYAVEGQPSGPLGFCQKCGAPIIGSCPSCGARVRGIDIIPGVFSAAEYEPPKFCEGCGEPLPWAGRQERFYQLENILDQQGIDETDRLLVQDDLRRLQVSSEMPEDKQVEIWRRIRARAPGVLVDAGLKIAETLMTAAIKAKVGGA
jgi:hypothetical protein